MYVAPETMSICALCACNTSSWRYGAACSLMYCERDRSYGICNGSIAVTVDGAEGDDLKLRLLVVEETVRYVGSNQLRFHHHVVRAMPGGAKGFPLKGKAGEQAVTVNPEQLRADLTRYLDEFTKESEFPRPDRPLGLKNLKVVAFVQNDATTEVLTAAMVELEGKKD